VLFAELPAAVQATCRPLSLFMLKGIAEPHLLYAVEWETLDCAVIGP
jgi:hypothetical protein